MTITQNLPPRRKRFQFSLRTLMIWVWAYGFLWLITIKFGPAQIGHFYETQYPYETKFKYNDDGSMLLTATTWGVPNYAESCKGSAVAPVPFVLIWHWEKVDMHNGNLPATSDIHF